MSSILFISNTAPPPALELLSVQVTTAETAADALGAVESADLALVDARGDLVAARLACQSLSRNSGTPVLLLVAPSGLPVIAVDWGFTDFVADGCEPAELDARIRIAVRSGSDPNQLVLGPIRVDPTAYSASLDGQPLDLTYTEFELLRYFMQHAGRVLSRETLVSQVWGYDYYGGTRTVDVHVRRLRAKLGQYDSYIGTVRNVGYRFASPREVNRAG